MTGCCHAHLFHDDICLRSMEKLPINVKQLSVNDQSTCLGKDSTCQHMALCEEDRAFQAKCCVYILVEKNYPNV